MIAPVRTCGPHGAPPPVLLRKTAGPTRSRRFGAPQPEGSPNRADRPGAARFRRAKPTQTRRTREARPGRRRPAAPDRAARGRYKKTKNQSKQTKEMRRRRRRTPVESRDQRPSLQRDPVPLMSSRDRSTREWVHQSASLKGGDPAAGSPTATLLRLHPSR